jgi:tetratricopeptide (TPR) repeat protein
MTLKVTFMDEKPPLGNRKGDSANRETGSPTRRKNHHFGKNIASGDAPVNRTKIGQNRLKFDREWSKIREGAMTTAMADRRDSLRRAAVLAAALAVLGGRAGGSAGGSEDFKTVRECLDLMYYDQAVRLLGNILAEDENAREARFWQGFALSRMGRLDQAAIALRGEIERFPDHWAARTLLGHVYYLLGRRAEAEEAAREASDLVSKKKPEERAKEANAGLSFYLKGMIAKEERRFEAAEGDFSSAAAYGYDPADAWLRIIECDLLAGTWQEAKAAKAFPVLAFFGREHEYHILVAAGQGRRGEVEAARKSLEAAYLKRPFEAGIMAALGCGYAERGEFAEAGVMLRRAERLVPEDVSLRARREEAEKKRNVFSGEFMKKLDELWAGVCSSHPPIFRYILYHDEDKVCRSINQRFLNFIQEGLFNDAAALVKKFLENADVSPTLNYNLGQLYNSLGHIRPAFPFAFQAISQKKDYRDAYDLLGGLFFQVGDFVRSAENYRAALALTPKDPVSNYHLGLVLKSQEKTAEAIELFEEAIRIENLSPTEKEPKTRVESKKSELDYSLTVQEEGIAYFARMQLGLIALDLEENDRAAVHFQEAARTRPKSPEPYFELARLHLKAWQVETAKKYLDLYLQLGGSEARARALLEKK